MKRFVLIAFVVLLVGCAGRPEDLLLIGTEKAPGTSKVEMLVATTRQRSPDPGMLFTGERARELSLADIEISIPPESNRKVGEVQYPKKAPGDPAKEFVTTRADILDREAARAALTRMLKTTGDGRVLLFVHGYNNRFEDAVFSFAQIAHDSNAPAVPILFTWPSRGTLRAYGYDRESANYSRDALEELLAYFDRTPAVKEVAILAHSMGNWVAMEALRQSAIRHDGKLSKKITNVILAAPDVDVDVFRTQLSQISKPRPQFILMASQDDTALAVSRRVWGGAVRLGAIDPNIEPYKDELAEEGVTVFDLTDIKGEGLNHSKFAEAPQVVQQIGKRLAAGQPLTTGRTTLGDRITMATSSGAAAVGGTIGLVVTAPLAVVSGRERETFGERAQEVGEHASEAIGATTCPSSSRRMGPVPPGCPKD